MKDVVMRKFVCAAVLASFCAGPTLGSAQDLSQQRVWRVADQAELSGNELIEAVGSADVVILGEIHDSAAIHATQAMLASALSPDAMVAEMVPMAREGALIAFLGGGGSPDEIGPKIGWDALGWPDWSMYAPIFGALRGDNLRGAALDRDTLMDVMRNGPAAIAFEPGIDARLAEPLTPELQKDAETEMMDAHCGHLPAKMAPGMVFVQRARDAALAAAVVRARDAGAERIAVITGNGHARTDVGLSTYLPGDLSILSIGLLETDRDPASKVAGQPFDYVMFHAPVDRGDPCESLRKK